MFDAPYVRQAEHMLRCLPEVGKQTCFAVKGGTAINLFLRSMPQAIGAYVRPKRPGDGHLSVAGSYGQLAAD